MKVVDIERVIILMRFIQFGWAEERKKAFDKDLRMMLETQCEDLADHDKQIRDEVIDEFVAECNLKIHNIQMEYEDDGIDFCSIEDIREIAEQMKG